MDMDVRRAGNAFDKYCKGDLMITREELIRMRNMTFDEINPDDVIDLDEADVDVTLSK